jgi:hypothetical protein
MIDKLIITIAQLLKDEPFLYLFCDSNEEILEYNPDDDIVSIKFPSKDGPYFPDAEYQCGSPLEEHRIYDITISETTRNRWKLLGDGHLQNKRVVCISYDPVNKIGVLKFILEDIWTTK